MKAKHYLTALVLPLALAACTNEEDFISNPNSQGETLTIAVTRGGFETTTRAAWIDETEGASFEWTTVSSDKIGMALLNPSDASKVLTNYEMSLLGWYNANGEGSSATYDQEAQNGVKYTASKPSDGNANAGVFQASGLTVMDGSYIVYHPYDADFAKAGYLAVDFKTNQSAESTLTSTATTVADAQTAMLAAAGDNAFSYSQPTTIEKGGKVAADFATTNLSALVKIALSDLQQTTKLKKVILLEDAANFDAASKGFLKSAHLNAEKIKTQNGAAVLESPMYTSMITFAFADGTNSNPGLEIASNSAANIYMVAGPRTSTSKYSILLINDENKASIWKSSVAFTAGNKSTINIKDDGNHPFDTFIVTDGADLKTILETATTYDDKTINVLGNLTVEDLATVAAKNVTIQAYGNNPESSIKFVAKTGDVTLASASSDTKGLKFNVPVTFETQSTNTMTLKDVVSLAELINTGALKIEGTEATVKTLTNDGVIDIAQQAVFNTTGNVINNNIINTAAADVSGSPTGATWNIGKNTTLTNNGEINNFFTINNFGTINNTNGIYVQKLEGKFIGENDIAADKRGNYVIEVKSDEQFTYANGTTCTTIRVVAAAIGAAATNILKDLTIEKKVELTGAASLKLSGTKLNGGLYVINDATNATIEGSATAELIKINAASQQGASAPKLTINAGSVIKAKAIVNDGIGSIKEGATGIPADVKTLSSTGAGAWDNYPQVVTSL